MIRRIAITGPESTGKSMLAEELAKHFNTMWVKEYARNYLETLGRHYDLQDILEIAKGQASSEESVVASASQYLFVDTDFLVLYIWSMDKYGICHPWISEKLTDHQYDLYLLCDIDIPWLPDPLREDPDRRQYFFNWYKQELINRKLPFAVINGIGDRRIKNAIGCIHQRFEGL